MKGYTIEHILMPLDRPCVIIQKNFNEIKNIIFYNLSL